MYYYRVYYISIDLESRQVFFNDYAEAFEFYNLTVENYGNQPCFDISLTQFRIAENVFPVDLLNRKNFMSDVSVLQVYSEENDYNDLL